MKIVFGTTNKRKIEDLQNLINALNLDIEVLGINDIGWNIEYKSSEIEKVLREVVNQPSVVDIKKNNCKKTKEKNLWTVRAKKVADDLTKAKRLVM